VAERLKLRVQTIYDYIRKGRLPAVRLGNRCRIAQSDLDAFLQRQTGPPRPVGRSRPAFRDPGAANDPVGDEVREQIERNRAARRLLAEWLADDSGYDDRVWPIVEKLIEENPVSFGDPIDD
jgi:excisionase family DNA binding protein